MTNRMFKRKTIIAGFFALTIALLSSTCWAKTYYIDPNAASGGAGTELSPFNKWSSVTWAAGNAYLQKRGTTSTSPIVVGANGNEGAWITLGAYGTGNPPVIYVQTGSAAILIKNRSYVKIENIKVVTSYGGAEKFKGDGISTYWGGSAGRNITIENVEVGPTHGHGILLYGVTNAIVRNSHLHESGTGLAADKHSSEDNIHFENCHNYLAEHNTSFGSVYGSEYDSSDSTGFSTGTFQYNIAWDGKGGGAPIKISGWDTRSTGNAYYNIVYNSDRGIDLQENLSGNVFNNVVYNTTEMAMDMSTTGKVNVRNNIIHTGTRGIVYQTVPESSENNVFYNLSKYLVNNVGRTYTNLADWKATGYGQGSLNTDPLFTDISNHNFTLRPMSPAINAGSYVSLAADIVNTSVPLDGIVDIGPYEHSMGVATTPPSAPTGLRIL